MNRNSNGKKKIGIPEIVLLGTMGLLLLAIVFAIVYVTVIRKGIAKNNSGTDPVSEVTQGDEDETSPDGDAEIDAEGYTDWVTYEEVGTNPFENRRRNDPPEETDSNEADEGLYQETDETDTGSLDGTNASDEENGDDMAGGADAEDDENAEADEDVDPERDAIIDEIIEDMSVREKVCQLFIVYPGAITGVTNTTQAGNMTKKALEEYPVAGFLYNKSNMENKEQLSKMLTGVQNFVDIPLILTCDEEGGRVERLMSKIGTTHIGPMYDYRNDGTEKAYNNAYIIASDMKSVGMNFDFAPVADVWSNPDNTVIGDRAYSDDFEQAAELVASAVRGFHEGGVACTLKHFPGHGDTANDTHFDTAVVTKTLDELRNQEFLPFKAGIDAGADAVMIGHMVVTDITDEPAVFSKQIVTDILRNELGFKGVVITDALEMGAIADNYTSAEAALKCIDAGVDIILCPADFESAVKEVEAAVIREDVDMDRIDESVRRILVLKYNMGLL